jgi:hypothetical protein
VRTGQSTKTIVRPANRYRIVAGGNNLMAGEYRGQGGILGCAAKEPELTGGRMSLAIEAIVGTDNYVFILSRPRYERNDSDIGSTRERSSWMLIGPPPRRCGRRRSARIGLRE